MISYTYFNILVGFLIWTCLLEPCPVSNTNNIFPGDDTPVYIILVILTVQRANVISQQPKEIGLMKNT